jgi:hypothetical protein
MPEATEGRGTRGIDINFVSRGGWQTLGRQDIVINVAQTAEVMPHHQYWHD